MYNDDEEFCRKCGAESEAMADCARGLATRSRRFRLAFETYESDAAVDLYAGFRERMRGLAERAEKAWLQAAYAEDAMAAAMSELADERNGGNEL